jgi:hypothetical protein
VVIMGQVCWQAVKTGLMMIGFPARLPSVNVVLSSRSA